MRNKFNEIAQKVLKRIKEQSSTGTGGASFSAGEGMQYATKFAFSRKEKPTKYYYRLGYKNIPKHVPKSYDRKQLWEDNKFNEFQQREIDALSEIEQVIKQLSPALDNAKDKVINAYSADPNTYDVVISTQLALNFLQNALTLLKGEE